MEMEKPKRRNDLLIAWVILVLIAVAATVVIVKLLNTTMGNGEKRHLTETTSYVSALYDGYVSVSQEQLLLLAENSQISQLATNLSPSSREKAANELTKSKNASASLKAIGVFDENGVLLAENQQASDFLGNGVSSQPFFKQAVDEKKALLSDAFVPPLLGTTSQAFVLPTKDSNDAVQTVIVGLIDIEAFKNYLSETQGSSAFTTVYDTKTNVIVTTQTDIVALQNEKDLIKSLLEKEIGNTQVTNTKQGFTAMKKGDYFAVSIVRSSEYIAKSTQQIFYIILGAAVIIHIIIMMLAAFRNAHMTNRINDLILVVQNMKKSGFATPVNESEINGRDALSELAREIDNLQKNKK